MKLLWTDWDVSDRVGACVTTRQEGSIQGSYAGFNLGQHVGDDPEAVKHNRQQLLLFLEEVAGVKAIQWVSQVHGTQVYRVQEQVRDVPPEADAVYTASPGIACAVLTADCLPVCLCSGSGDEVAVAHAGWRGLLAGVLENTVQSFAARPDQLHAWLGPAIGPCHFEVGEDVRQGFLDASTGQNAAKVGAAFTPGGSSGKWMCDLYQLARLRLAEAGVRQVSGGGLCTVCDAERFYSYRREAQCGRFATLVYRKY